MVSRKIIEIDRDKCNGCARCTTACAEGALVMDRENKAVLAKEIFCDGMGACLDVCPVGALKIVEKESADYNPQAAYQHVLKTQGVDAAQKVHGALTQVSRQSNVTGGCPGSAARSFTRLKAAEESPKMNISTPSELEQWPIQLHLVSPHAPYFRNCDLLIAADCTAFALGSFHGDLLKGKKLVIACPKLDETQDYVEKLMQLIKSNQLKSLTVVIMEVPCCFGLLRMVEEAVALSKTAINIETVIVHIDGTTGPGPIV